MASLIGKELHCCKCGRILEKFAGPFCHWCGYRLPEDICKELEMRESCSSSFTVSKSAQSPIVRPAYLLFVFSLALVSWVAFLKIFLGNLLLLVLNLQEFPSWFDVLYVGLIFISCVLLSILMKPKNAQISYTD